MKTLTCFLLLAMLAISAVADKPSARMHAAAAAIPSSSRLHVRKTAAAAAAAAEAAHRDAIMRRDVVVEGEGEGEGVGTSDSGAAAGGGAGCITQDMCNKKKVICTKKCFKYSHGEVQKKHFYVPKCSFICKKCVPTC